ncbi:MAG: hypothetical protein AB1861_20825 [Cyanobacteriota bacterium]
MKTTKEYNNGLVHWQMLHLFNIGIRRVNRFLLESSNRQILKNIMSKRKSAGEIGKIVPESNIESIAIQIDAALNIWLFNLYVIDFKTYSKIYTSTWDGDTIDSPELAMGEWAMNTLNYPSVFLDGGSDLEGGISLNLLVPGTNFSEVINEKYLITILKKSKKSKECRECFNNLFGCLESLMGGSVRIFMDADSEVIAEGSDWVDKFLKCAEYNKIHLSGLNQLLHEHYQNSMKDISGIFDDIFDKKAETVQ